MATHRQPGTCRPTWGEYRLGEYWQRQELSGDMQVRIGCCVSRAEPGLSVVSSSQPVFRCWSAPRPRAAHRWALPLGVLVASQVLAVRCSGIPVPDPAAGLRVVSVQCPRAAAVSCGTAVYVRLHAHT